MNRRFQFSIRTLIWLTLVVAIGCMLGRPAWDFYADYRLTRQAEQEIEQTVKARHRKKWKANPRIWQRRVDEWKKTIANRGKANSQLFGSN